MRFVLESALTSTAAASEKFTDGVWQAEILPAAREGGLRPSVRLPARREVGMAHPRRRTGDPRRRLTWCCHPLARREGDRGRAGGLGPRRAWGEALAWCES